MCALFVFNDTATPEIYTLSLHDALPIWEAAGYPWSLRLKALLPLWLPWARSEEHTSELQSLTNLVCRLLLEKKKKKPLSARPALRGSVSGPASSATRRAPPAAPRREPPR